MRLRLLLTAAVCVLAQGAGRAADVPPANKPIEAVIDQLIDAAIADDRRYTWSAALFASQLFLALAADVSRNYPGFDIEAFLRKAALQLELEDETGD